MNKKWLESVAKSARYLKENGNYDLNISLTQEEMILLTVMSKPKHSMSDFEKYALNKGINPYAPWMKEDHKRCEELRTLMTL